MKIIHSAAAAALCLLAGLPSGAQILTHRYSFKGNANDSVGTAHATMIGNTTIQYDANNPAANGSVVFGGGTSSSNPAYLRLPVSAISGLQNATIEIFTTGFATPGSPFQALFNVSSAYPNTATYAILSPNRSGAGIGLGTRLSSGAETVIASIDPLPDGVQAHVVDLVYSGFTAPGSVGTVTIYLDGQQAAQGKTSASFALLATGAGGIATVGIGGGSPFNDPTLKGSITEVRIFNGALTPQQVAANADAGPATVASLGTLTGRIALGGLADMGGIRAGVPAPVVTVDIRVPNTGTLLRTLTLSPVAVGAGSAFGTFSLSGVPTGSVDVAIKGDKQLRVVLKNVTVGSPTTTLPDVTLPGGDSNGDNMVDIGDFGVLVNAYGGDITTANSGYDAAADYNYDGVIDIGDFGLLVNNYNAVGAL